MKKRIRSILAYTVVLVLCIMCLPTTSVFAANGHQVKQMGQVTVHFSSLDSGIESFSYYINLNGYVPKTISSTISGDFTEAEMQAALDSGAYMADDYRIGLLPKPTMNTVGVNSLDEMIDTMNNLHGNKFTHNIYESNRTLTSVEYSLLPPGDKEWNGISLYALTSCVRYAYNTPYKPTTHKIYMDGQLILEYSCYVSSSGTSVIPQIKVHDANFQMPAAERSVTQVAVEPTTSKVYVDGNQVDIGGYLIEGNNYMRLRDIAYVLRGTNAEFGVAWHQDKNLVELLPGEKYSVLGDELAALSPANATISSSQVTSKITNIVGNVSQESFVPTTYNVGDNNFYKLRDIAHMAGFNVSWDAAANSVQIVTR